MSFITELKRRNVIRTGLAYLAVSWLLIEVSNTILPMFDFGPEVPRLIVLVLAIGLVPVLLFTWAFEFTPEGLKLDKDVDRAAPGIQAAGKRLDRIVIALLGLALAWFAFDKFVLSPARESAVVESVRQQATSEALEQARVEAFAQSIAILPFANASGDASNDYLSNGISDELRDRLAQLPGVRVMARSSSIHLAEQNLDLADIAARFGVSRVIEGRFNRQGKQVLLSVQLIDATSGFQLWSQTYERSSQDLLLLQLDLARSVVGRMMPELSQQENPAAPSAPQVSAHDLLLLGRQYEQKVTDQQLVDEDNLRLAIDYYRQAIAADPQSAEAHARLGKMLLYQGDIAAAEQPILRALELDAQLSEVQTTLGLYYWVTRQDGVGAAYQRAVELNPNNADALSYYAGWLWVQGKVTAASDYYRSALEVDPLSLVRHADLGYLLAFEGLSVEEVAAIIDRLVALFPTAPGYLAAARIAEASGAPDEGIAYALKARQLRPDDPDISSQLAEMHARIGDFASADLFEPEPGMGLLFWEKRYDELIDLGEELMIDEPDDPDVYFLLAFGLNANSQFDRALWVLESAGMPDTALGESRRANELLAMNTYVGALAAIGEKEQVVNMANWYLQLNLQFTAREKNNAWAPNLSMACMLASLDQDQEALDWLETLKTLSTVVWLPWLKDHFCFQKFADEPRYQAVVKAIEDRLAAIRQRLPETLQRHGLLSDLPDQK